MARVRRGYTLCCRLTSREQEALEGLAYLHERNLSEELREMIRERAQEQGTWRETRRENVDANAAL